MVIQILHCRYCQSQNVIKHGRDINDCQRFRCRDCRRTFRQMPKSRSRSVKFQKLVLAAYQERASMRGVCRCVRHWAQHAQPVAKKKPRTCHR